MENTLEKIIADPESASEITKEWLQKILHPIPSIHEIDSIELDNAFGPISLLGKAVRVKITYKHEGSGRASVIVKFQVKVDKPKREGQIYQKLSEGGIDYIPKLFGVFGNGHLVLEDLSQTHDPAEKNEELTLNQIRNVIIKLADLNSRFWGDTDIPKEDLIMFVNSINFNMNGGWEAFKNRYQSQLGEDTQAFEWMWKNAELVSKYYNSGTPTMTHGDVNRGNLLFPKDGSDKPIFIDWQLSGQKVLAFDISYFIIKQLTVKQRKEHEDELLRAYYAALPGYVREKYTFEHLQLDYRACVLRTMLSAVTNMGPFFQDFIDRLERSDRLAERVIAAVKDLKPIEAIRELREHDLF